MSSTQQRRHRLLEWMRSEGGGIAIIPTAGESLRNSDVHYPYRPDSYFHYLTQFEEPEAWLVLDTRHGGRATLFCRARNEEREIWDGLRYGPEGARTSFGFDDAYPIEELDQRMPDLMAGSSRLFFALGYQGAHDQRVQQWLGRAREQIRRGVPVPERIINPHPVLDDMRLIKDEFEIATMREAARISALAHERAMRHTRPGKHEYEIEAELLFEFRRHGSEFPAYGSIVAAGANACILHYSAGSTIVADGELVLIDAGCELKGYASDITRTYPANGIFSGPQRELYEIVLAAQYAAIEQVAPGRRFNDAHDAAVHVLAQGMLDTGLLNRQTHGTLDDVISSGAYRKFYMHKTGHWLGRDVHDVGRYFDAEHSADSDDAPPPSRTLCPGMVVTVEPGIYVRPGPDVPDDFWNIGIRIEDDVLVTEQGHDILSRGAPKTIADIEDCMNLE